MTTVMHTDETAHRLVIRGDYGVRVVLVRGGPRRAYLWIGDKDGKPVGYVDGEKALRALAEGILAELDAD